MNTFQKVATFCATALFVAGVGWYLFGTTQVEAPVISNDGESNIADEELKACTAEAKMCPDGSFVGRTGPDCQFAPCPEIASPERITCTDEMKQAEACTLEYAPVCGLVEVQCIKAPCYPVPETFSNGCSACAQGNVTSYTEGECTIEVN